MKLKFLLLAFGTLLGAWNTAQARVFNASNENFAAYVGGSWGSSFENSLNSESNSTAAVPISINDKHPYNLSGEFGVVYGGPRGVLRLGLEIIRPNEIKDEIAKDSAEAELYSLTSEITVLIPKAAVEISLKKWNVSRMFVMGGVGYGSLAARNSYTFTSAGSTAYGSLADFYEDLRGYALMYEGGLGFEALMNDMTTVVIQTGYRSLKFTEIKHNRDVTTFQGSVSKGDVATNADGSNRSLNMSNYFVGLSFRFWIH